jgi:hypothetical protein
LTLPKPSLTLAQLAEVMKPFVDKFDLVHSSRHVFAPADDALKKSGLKPEELDAVLFIGGSSANPLVRAAVMAQLPAKVEAITPKDLRSHVSLGAALHSFSHHALNFDFIKPVTSEPIFALTRDDHREILVPASTEVPTPSDRQAVCRVAQAGQKLVELPICVGDSRKLLGILRLSSAKPGGFSQGDSLVILARITREKLLEVEARIGEERVSAALLNPLANEELSPVEQKLLEAKQRFNLARLNCGRDVPFAVVLEYAQAAAAAEAFEIAADMYMAAERIDPSVDLATDICFVFSRAGLNERARDWAEIAFQRRPNSVTAFNLSLWKEGEEKETLLRQSLFFDSSWPSALLELGQLLTRRSDPEGRALLNECVKILEPRLGGHSISERDLGTLISAATLLDRKDLADRARDALARQRRTKGSFGSSLYENDNLAESAGPTALPRS